MRGAWTVLLGIVVLATPAAQALPTPGLFGEEARTATGRLFPEAMQTNDYVSYGEAVESLKLLADENPDLVTYETVGKSLGWDNLAGGHDRFPVPVVTVTDKTSDVPMDDRVNLLFQLSIHGNEKGGREGAVRVIEDFTKAVGGDSDIGMATEDRVEMLDYMQLVFLFHNPDGWTHEEAQYRHNDAGYTSFSGVEAGNFVRTNSNGTDLNRQAPTQGWSRGEGSHAALSEPSTRAVVPWLENNFTDIHYATDIHGMLYPANALVNSSRPIQCFPPSQAPDNPVTEASGEVCLREGNFVLTMLPAAQMTPEEMTKTTRLAEVLKQRMNSDPSFTEWNTLPGAGVWGGEYNGWGTVWDTIGYVDSGFHSDWFAQDTGLDAPGVDFEYSYNHLVFDNYYPGLAQRINDYHVQTTRIIVGTFMDVAAETHDVRLDPGQVRTAWVPTDLYATSEDNGELTRWAAENPADDAWDWAHGGGYNATINDYFHDRDATVASVDGSDALVALEPDELSAQLDAGAFDNLVLPGSAVERVIDDGEAVDAIRAFVEDGGRLLLTDSALQLLSSLGIVDADMVDDRTAYAGYTNWADRGHAFADGVRGLARQTYEPMPLGFSIATDDGGSSPIWVVNRTAFEDAGGTTVGTLGPEQVNVGKIALGDGEIAMIGALLPDPTEEFYHPYGLASYATTYTGDQLVNNALGWELVTDTQPRAQDGNLTLPGDEDESLDQASTDEDGNDTPFPGLLAVVAALSAALVLMRRRTGRAR